jgi:uncharacterized protein
MQKILVTGGTGFIGQHLVRQLLSSGHHITILTRQPEKAQKLFLGKVIFISSLSDLAPNVVIDIVINLAGARILGWRWSTQRKKVLIDSRVKLTQQLVNWVARAECKPKLFLSASAIGFYGIQPVGDQSILTEESSPQNIFMSQLCQQWEAVANSITEHNVQLIIMRFGLVLGAQGALPMMLMPVKLGLSGRLGHGSQWISWIHINDLLAAINHLIQQNNSIKQDDSKQKTAIYNFTAPEAVTQLSFHKVAADILHRPCIIPTPSWILRLVLGEQADLLLEGQRVFPANLLSSGFKFSYPELKQALSHLIKK